MLKIFVIILFFLLSSQVALASFGVSPPFVNNSKLSKGATFEQEIIIVRSDPKDDLKAKIIFDLPKEIEDWISIDKMDKNNSFILPKGEKQNKIIVKVEVPKRAKLGKYTGAIHLNTEQSNIEKGVVTIALGVQIDVNLEVVDIKIFDFVIRGVKIPDLEEGHKFLFWHIPTKIKAIINYENLGNIKSHPTKAVLVIYDENGKKIQKIESHKRMKKINPFTAGEIELLFKTDLPVGGYNAELQIWKDEEVRYQGDVTISILSYGALEKEGLSIIWKVVIAVVIVLISGAVAYSWLKRKKKHKR